MEPWLLQAALAALIAVVGYLLRQKDVEQGVKIDKLFAIHDRDVEKLAALELKIAQEHYIKPELDVRFTEIKQAIKESMDILGGKFDKLSDILIAHVAKEDKRHED